MADRRDLGDLGDNVDTGDKVDKETRRQGDGGAMNDEPLTTNH